MVTSYFRPEVEIRPVRHAQCIRP